MRVLGIVALAVALLGGGAAAQSPSATPSAAPTTGTQELLGVTFPGGSSEARLVLLRTTLEPGEQRIGLGWGGTSVS